ncbi:hypothetical protein SOV_42120 [Sporomusa ovata DSM 2662]|uniref:Uncharacterized protein n=2 Tax=Sporomusa ovata TaxID=2378 RepID=A0A0U1KUC7_9FIRM|nr:hypothetical protein [Sporomusa ovata]EQB26600.1 hypothetical protein SOV_3c04740 [Sporomusa ovata DSM 2662]CQR70689.1 hypothetical protein SpAn4DRAFT_1667 [Sporomusa ovata]
MNTYLREEDEIKISQKRVDEFCKKYHFPPMKVRSILMQANIRIFHAIVIPYEEIEFFLDPLVLQCREAQTIIRNIIRNHLNIVYEQQYRQSIRHLDYIFVYLDGEYRLFIITIFEKPVICRVVADIQNLETQHAGMLAKKLRYLTGRGPQNTKAICMNSSLIVYIINGLVSKGDKLFAAKSLDNGKCIERIANHNLKEAFDSMYTGTAINNVNIIDIDNDISISLVFEAGEFALSNNELAASEFCHKQLELISMFTAR